MPEPESVEPVLVMPEAPKDSRSAGTPFEFTLNGVKWKFRWCPAGSFTMEMGTGVGKYGHTIMASCGKETPHKVILTNGFYMAETETTQEQWETVTGNNPSKSKGNKLPVSYVSWDDCHEFVEKLNGIFLRAENFSFPIINGGLKPAALKGFEFALPTEAQWEYACRAGSTTAFGTEKTGMILGCLYAIFLSSRRRERSE